MRPRGIWEVPGIIELSRANLVLDPRFEFRCEAEVPWRRLQLHGFPAANAAKIKVNLNARLAPDSYAVCCFQLLFLCGGSAPCITHRSYPSVSMSTLPSGDFMKMSPSLQSPRFLFERMASGEYPVTSENLSIVMK